MGYDQGLVGHWKMIEGSGITAYDSSGRGNNGSLGGGVSANMPVWIYKGLRFDGTNDYIDCGNAQNLSLVDAISLETWIYIIGDSSDLNSRIISKSTDSYNIYIQSAPHEIYFYVNFITQVFGGVLSRNQWYHVVATYNKSLISQNLKIYINGTLKDTADDNSGITQNSANVRIGDGTAIFPRHFNGIIGEFKIYNRDLSAAEVMRHYTSETYKYQSN